MRRLYVGGLSHAITEKDLKDRFGKFGNVEDVELRTRRDEEGLPYKTFGYININISDADLKKCFTVLNKSKWKGGTLQIETAKESFLHRLAQERQVAAEQRLQQHAKEDTRQKMLDSMSKAGVENFTMKAAVPGTEIPGHKDWIVSKFGRVLPVLQLNCQRGSKARTLKYDPSKYSHNIRKLDRDATDKRTPVTQLTWELQGGDDDISKKRRGEFPPYVPPKPKRMRMSVVNSPNAISQTRPVEPVNRTENQFTNGFKPSTNQRPIQRKGAYLNDSDVDSDEEIRRLVSAQQTSHSLLQRELEDDNLEVVGLDYLVKSEQKDNAEENDYDSADTDELFASRKPPHLPEQRKPAPKKADNTDIKRKTKTKNKVEKQKEEEKKEQEDSSDAEENLVSRKPSSTQQNAAKLTTQKKGVTSEAQIKSMTVLPSSDSDSGEEDEDDEELESDSCSDSDYEAMFSNVTHLEISLADLQRLAEETQLASETTVPSIPNTGPKQETNLTACPAKQPAPLKGNLPEDILAAILEDDRSDDEQKKKTKKRKGVLSTPLPAFQGTGALNKESETAKFVSGQGREDIGKDVVKKQKLDPDEAGVDKEQENKRNVVKNMAAVKKVSVTTDPTENLLSSSESDEEEEEEEMKASGTVEAAGKASPSSSSSSSEEDEEKHEIIAAKQAVKATAPDSESSSTEEDEEKDQGLPRMPLKAEDEEELQRKANLRRLAAIQQRQRESEEHKKLIQGALSNLDAPKAGAGKHIVFGSDEEEEEEEQQTTTEAPALKKSLFQESQSEDESTGDEASANRNRAIEEKVHPKPTGPQLFGGSEDEDNGDEEADGSRFDIRPQFEGRAGQKLMALQSRFGTDERFRMDSRFLEEEDDDKQEEESGRNKSATEDEEALEEERKKNLEILQSVLGSSQQTCSKTGSKAKTFRDVAALHYDPSKEEHAAFETPTDETKKESKSARRKKREEAQKLPDVSKEIYFDISGDLKAVFGQTKSDVAGQEEKTSWDQEEEEEAEGQDEELPLLASVLTADPSAEKEESSGFRFSFFGEDTETENPQTAEYKVESIQAPKVSWHQDPRFHDSSSDEDEEEQEEEEEKTSTAINIREEETPSKTGLFFFHPEDSRLTEGPRLFYRSSQLEDQREQWEERRNALRQEYRKKHKDARRKLRTSQKT